MSVTDLLHKLTICYTEQRWLADNFRLGVVLVNQGHTRITTMDILQEIVNIVTSKKDAKRALHELDPTSSEYATIAGQYLRGIVEDQFEDDEDAARQLYGTSARDARYRTMKSRTYDRLLQSVLFLQVRQPEHSEYLSYYYRCMRNTFVAQTLMRFAARKAGFAVASKTLTTAQRYQFTDLCLTLSVMLRETAAVWFRRAAFMQYNALVQKYLRQLEAEYQSEYLLDHLGIEINIMSRTQAHLEALHISTRDAVGALYEEYRTHTLRLNYIRTSMLYYEFMEDFYAVMRTCDEAVAYLDDHPHLSQQARYGEFILQKMSSALVLRHYEEAHVLSERCIASFSVGGNNWYYACDLAFVAAINMAEYAAAENIYIKATSQRKLALQSERTRERWVIYGAYLYVAERLGLYVPTARRTRAFRLSTFMNSVPEQSKSKKVYNVLILVAQFIILVLNGDYDAAEKRSVYLRVYASRYLKESHFARIRLFLKILHTFPRFSFLAREIRENTQHLMRKLVASGESDTPSETNELIQFEILLEALLTHIEQTERMMEDRV